MTRVLVTGAGGFIGQKVAAQLMRDGHQVIGLGRGRAPEGLNFTYWGGEGVSLESLFNLAANVETIYHCAGSGSVSLSVEDPGHDFDSNVLTLRAVFEFARRQGGKRVVLLSSAGVYGSVATMPIRLDTPMKPVSPYGHNKVICENLARQYAECFEVPIAIIRLFSVYGEGLRKQLLWDASVKLCKGQGTFFGTGMETRDWIHVDDAVNLIVEAGNQTETQFSILNGGVGCAVPNKKIIESLADCLGYQGDIEFSGEQRVGDPKHYEADISEALLIGWQPIVSLDDGVGRYANWFKKINVELCKT